MSLSIKVYLIARVSEDAQLWNNKICSEIKHPIEVFMPQTFIPLDKKHEDFPKAIFDTCLKAMKESHLGLLLPEYGSDCSFEVGWYSNSEKPVLCFVDHQKEWLKDWMIKGGLDYVATTNKETFEVFKKNPILKHKQLFLIENISDLNNLIRDIILKKKTTP